MDPKSNHEKRRWPRYDIAPIPSVKAVLHGSQVPTKLGTIGMGGCGFWADYEDPNLVIGQEVTCSIRFDGVVDKNLEIKGRIQYIRQPQNDVDSKSYYGIEFLAGYEAVLTPIIRYLEKLEKLGRILVSID